MTHQIMDAQKALSFLINQMSVISSEVYEQPYLDLQYANLIPIDFSMPEWVQSITYMSMDAVGEAGWFHGKAQDVPNVELTRSKTETTVHMAAIGFRYDLEELGKASSLGMNLNADKGMAARRIAEEFTEKVAIAGDPAKGLTGLVNAPSVTASTAPADGTGSATTFATKTPDQILRDVNGILTGMFITTSGHELADTLLLPYSVLLDIGTRRIDTVNQTTILEWIKRNNVYTLTTGRELTIQGIFVHLDESGAGSTKRMIAYRRAPDVLKMYIPMAYKMLPVWQMGPMLFEVPGILRLGGVDVRRPKAIRYLDGV